MSFQDAINAQQGARQRANATGAPSAPGAPSQAALAGKLPRKPRGPGTRQDRVQMLAQFVKRHG